MANMMVMMYDGWCLHFCVHECLSEHGERAGDRASERERERQRERERDCDDDRHNSQRCCSIMLAGTYYEHDDGACQTDCRKH